MAQGKRDVLEKFTKDKTAKQLRSDLEKARSHELVGEQTWNWEKRKQTRLEHQIANCKLLAPADGMFVYANVRDGFSGLQSLPIAEGAIVRERQKIFTIPDLDAPIRVKVKVHESMIAKLSPGLPATVKLDAFPETTLTGIVEQIAPVPDPKTVFDPDVNVYSTSVSIAKGIPGLRPGMGAMVDILVAELEGVLTVPIQAVVWYDQKDHVAVKTADNAIEWREVTLGLADGQRVEVKEGLESGETVAPEPEPLLTQEQRRKIALSPPRPIAKPKANPRRAAIFPTIGTKIQTLGPEDRGKLRGASPDERRAILKRAGLTDDEIRQLNSMLSQPAVPQGGGRLKPTR
jgi:multidrug efflux pump subunit AcrA (membrane-fusion protein)